MTEIGIRRAPARRYSTRACRKVCVCPALRMRTACASVNRGHLTAKRDLEAAKRSFRKMLQDQPLSARPDRHRRGRLYLPAIVSGEKRRPSGAHPAPLCHQVPAAGDRGRSLPGQEADAADRQLSIRHGAAHDLGLRGHALAAQGLWLCGRVDGAHELNRLLSLCCWTSTG